jgi:CTP:molybdopterin cytidylyltransferase MocA
MGRVVARKREKVIPIILAAGRSRRMGFPKATCNFYGKTALEIALEVCRDSGCGRPIVILGFESKKIIQNVNLKNVKIFTNKNYKAGQVSSLKLGLLSLEDKNLGFIAYPVDFPLVTVEDIKLLIRAFKNHKTTSKKIFIPVYNKKKGHPVLFDITIKEEIMALGNDEPLHKVVRKVPSRIVLVKVNNPYITLNMNSPKEYTFCLKQYYRRIVY